jgi:MFS family permease
MVMVWVFVVIFGFAFGGIFTLIPLTIGNRFPLPAFSILYSFVNLMFLGGTLLGPLIAGIVYDSTGNYAGAFWGFIGSYVIAILAIYFTWGPNYRPFHGTRTKTTAVQ